MRELDIALGWVKTRGHEEACAYVTRLIYTALRASFPSILHRLVSFEPHPLPCARAHVHARLQITNQTAQGLRQRRRSAR